MYAVKGDLVEVKKVSETEYADKNGNTYDKDELVLLEETDTKPIDWEQRRYEIARDLMAVSFNQYVKSMSAKDFTDICLEWVDALIEELKGQANELESAPIGGCVHV